MGDENILFRIHRGAGKYRSNYLQILEFLLNYNNIISEHFDVGNTSGSGEQVEDAVISARDVQRIRGVDLLIAEVSQSSIDVGYAMTVAKCLGIPVLALYGLRAENPISAMIASNPRLSFVRYASLDALWPMRTPSWSRQPPGRPRWQITRAGKSSRNGKQGGDLPCDGLRLQELFKPFRYRFAARQADHDPQNRSAVDIVPAQVGVGQLGRFGILLRWVVQQIAKQRHLALGNPGQGFVLMGQKQMRSTGGPDLPLILPLQKLMHGQGAESDQSANNVEQHVGHFWPRRGPHVRRREVLCPYSPVPRRGNL